MLTYLTDLLTTATLKARYRRRIQEQVLHLLEQSPQPVAEDPGHWTLLGHNKSVTDPQRTDTRTRARHLVTHNPHAKNLLRLLEIYATGPALKLTHTLQTATSSSRLAAPQRDARRSNQPPSTSPAPNHACGLAPTPENLPADADHLWSTFLHANHRHFTFREYARRTWRDGECFLRTYATGAWPPAVRFIDPEAIAPTPDHPDSQGILTEPADVETPTAYLRIDPASQQLAELIPANEILHTKINADSNQKRGLSLFAPILEPLHCFDKWLDTELIARKLQASIVLWRKVQGSPSQAAAFADAALGSDRRERYRPGTILTTSHGTDLQYLQPNTNFGDAVPLGRLLLLSCAAGVGLPEFMLTSDASNANFASTMVAEGPAVKLFQAEQEFFAAEFRHLWHRVISHAVTLGLLPDDFFDQVDIEWTFPQLIARDRPRERLADARLVETRILSRAEVARRDGVNPTTMQSEINLESPSPPPSTS